MLYFGIDVHDKRSNFTTLDEGGDIVCKASLPTTEKGFAANFNGKESSKIAIEAGAHSHWIAKLLRGWGHLVIVANPRRVQLIAKSREKDDDSDSEKLARLLRADPKLLHPTHTRDNDNLALRGQVKARAALVECRTKLINCVRGLVKPFGAKIGRTHTENFHKLARETKMADEVRCVIAPLLCQIESLSEEIAEYDKAINAIEIERPDHPVSLMKTVPGIANLIATSYIGFIDDPHRFLRSEQVGKYVGLTSGRRFSGGGGHSLGITKEGDPQMRALMIQAAYSFLACKQDSDLKQWALALLERKGGSSCKAAKKKVVCALARKLCVLLHRIWITREPYQPFYHSQRNAEKTVVHG